MRTAHWCELRAVSASASVTAERPSQDAGFPALQKAREAGCASCSGCLAMDV